MTKKMIVALAVEDWMADVAIEAEEAEAKEKPGRLCKAATPGIPWLQSPFIT